MSTDLSLPLELVEEVLNKITSQRTLKSCCLTGRLLLNPSRRCLFRTITLGPPACDLQAAFNEHSPRFISSLGLIHRQTSCERFHELVTQHEEIATYVQHLTIIEGFHSSHSSDYASGSLPWVNQDDSLPPLLRSLTNLKGVSLEVAEAPSNQRAVIWDALNEDTKKAFSSAFQRPSIQRLSIDGMFAFANAGQLRSMIPRSPNLKELYLSWIYLVEPLEQSTESEEVNTGDKSTIKSLGLHYSSSVLVSHLISPKSPIDITCLQELTFSRPQPTGGLVNHPVIDILHLQRNHSTLTTLCLTEHYMITPNLFSSFLPLPSLTTFRFCFYFFSSQSAALTRLLNSGLLTPTSVPALEEISLRIKIKDPEVFEAFPWSLLDHVASKDGAKLTRLRVLRLRFCFVSVSREVMNSAEAVVKRSGLRCFEEVIREKVPAANERGVLVTTSSQDTWRTDPKDLW